MDTLAELLEDPKAETLGDTLAFKQAEALANALSHGVSHANKGER